MNGSLMASAFIVPPESMKVPPSALLRQVIFIMLAMALLFMIPTVRRFRTRVGMARSDAYVRTGGRLLGRSSCPQDLNHHDYAVLGRRHQARHHGERNHHAIGS